MLSVAISSPKRDCTPNTTSGTKAFEKPIVCAGHGNRGVVELVRNRLVKARSVFAREQQNLIHDICIQEETSLPENL